jgi:integrase
VWINPVKSPSRHSVTRSLHDASVGLTFTQVQQRDGRWCVVDLVGKHGRVRTAPMPTWVKLAIDAWTAAADIADGHVFRPVNRADDVGAEGLGEKVVWQLIKPYAEAAGVPGIAPHDLRRTCAKLCRAAGGELEQIQLLLGNASVQPGAWCILRPAV